MSGKTHAKSMADIVAEVKQEALESDEASTCCDYEEFDGHFFRSVGGELLTPQEARDLAASSRLVIWDSCGSGSWSNAYVIWDGPDVDALLEAGLPRFRNGTASEIEDHLGNPGLLLERDIRWGPLR